jgi:elongation factor G
MKVYDTPDLRNVTLIGHGDSGKTSLASALLYVAGAVNRLGRTEDGTAITDFDDEEIARKISLQTAVAHLEHRGKKINLIDTPGYAAFVGASKAGPSVADFALVLVEGVAGVQVLTARTFRFAEEYGVPVAFVVNKLDRERSSFDRCLAAIQERFGRTAIPLTLPIGEEEGLSGVVDLVSMQALTPAGDGSPKVSQGAVPDAMAEAAGAARAALVEMVAESDEKLMESYFEAGELTQEQLVAGLRSAVRDRKILPVFATSSTRLVGVTAVLDAIVDLAPSPSDRGELVARNPADGSEIKRAVSPTEHPALFVFKTVADPFAGRLSLFRVVSGTVRGDTSVVNVRTGNPERLGSLGILQGKQTTNVTELKAGDLGVVAKLKETRTNDTLCDPAHRIEVPAIQFPEPSISFAVEPKSKGDEEKISTALARVIEEDPVLRAGRDPQTNELLLSGSSQIHVEVAIQKMRKKFGVDATLKQPKVPYLETIRKKVGPIEGKHKKQSGGRGQFGVCVIEMEPLPRGRGFEFVDKIFGGSIPQNYRPAVEKGIHDAASRGYLAGYPVVDFRVTLLDGKYHDVDSSEMAFKIAGSLAFQEAMKAAKPVLLEPVMAVEIHAPEEFMGDLMGDLSSHRGKPQGMESDGGEHVIKAQVPMAEMLTFPSRLKSITSDRGSYHMEFDHYEEVPSQIQEAIASEAAKAKEQA